MPIFLLHSYSYQMLFNKFNTFWYSSNSHLIIIIFFSINMCSALFLIGFLNINLLSSIIRTTMSICTNTIIIIIEIFSHFLKMFSLAIRLSANIMAGHTLVYIIRSFIVNVMNYNIYSISMLVYYP